MVSNYLKYAHKYFLGGGRACDSDTDLANSMQKCPQNVNQNVCFKTHWLFGLGPYSKKAEYSFCQFKYW